MKDTVFRSQKRITAAQLSGLFEGLPVPRRPPQTPETIGNSQQVLAAWRDDQLVGVATASRDTVVNLEWL